MTLKGVIADAGDVAAVLNRWYNCIASGQMQFTKEHLDEAATALEGFLGDDFHPREGGYLQLPLMPFKVNVVARADTFFPPKKIGAIKYSAGMPQGELISEKVGAVKFNHTDGTFVINLNALPQAVDTLTIQAEVPREGSPTGGN